MPANRYSLAATGMPTVAQPLRPQKSDLDRTRPRPVCLYFPIVGCFAIVHVLLTIINVVLVRGAGILMTPMRVIGS
jgi:hypothetical protein